MMLFRLLDCDMFMRYQWNLGVGHSYSHAAAPRNAGTTRDSACPPETHAPVGDSAVPRKAGNTHRSVPPETHPTIGLGHSQSSEALDNSDCGHSEDETPELSLENREVEDWHHDDDVLEGYEGDSDSGMDE